VHTFIAVLRRGPVSGALGVAVLQHRAGDLLAVQNQDLFVLFAVLTKAIIFGGNWTFVFYQLYDRLPSQPSTWNPSQGFNAFVDLIAPKREGRLHRISRGNDFAALAGPRLLQQEPTLGSRNFQIYRWRNKSERSGVEYVHFTDKPTPEEAAAPRYSCLSADFAWDLAARNWTTDQTMWTKTAEATPNNPLDR
jgi:hypothetical protein